MRALTLFSVSLALGACGVHETAGGQTIAQSVRSIVWGPQLGDSNLSVIAGAEDEFGSGVGAAFANAARAIPNGASQASQTEAGRTARQITLKVVRNQDENLVYEVSDGRYVEVLAPGTAREGFDLALFANVPAGIEPDPSSYPHEVLGIWAWNGEAGAFWSASSSIPAAAFVDTLSETDKATYVGELVGVFTIGDASEKVLADVALEADISGRSVSGKVSRFRSMGGDSLDDLSVMLGRANFSSQGGPFFR